MKGRYSKSRIAITVTHKLQSVCCNSWRLFQSAHYKQLYIQYYFTHLIGVKNQLSVQWIQTVKSFTKTSVTGENLIFLIKKWILLIRQNRLLTRKSITPWNFCYVTDALTSIFTHDTPCNCLSWPKMLIEHQQFCQHYSTHVYLGFQIPETPPIVVHQQCVFSCPKCIQ